VVDGENKGNDEQEEDNIDFDNLAVELVGSAPTSVIAADGTALVG
jgi:hypothetical protein